MSLWSLCLCPHLECSKVALSHSHHRAHLRAFGVLGFAATSEAQFSPPALLLWAEKGLFIFLFLNPVL